MLHHEIEQRFGVLPNFFRLTSDTPEVTANLWGFAKFAYLDSPLPSLFKERLFVYLSRFCEVRYCIARHIGFLVGLGYPAGDRDCLPQTVEQVLPLLQRPLPRGEALESVISGIVFDPDGFDPAPDTLEEWAIFACATHVFLQTPDAPSAIAALEQSLGTARLERLNVFLTFVRMAHYWAQIHPELRFEDDINQLLATHETLANCILNDPEIEDNTLSQQVLAELAELRQLKEEHDLQANEAVSREHELSIERQERQRVEENLRDLEARFSSVFSNNMVAMGIWTEAGGIADANDALLNLIGYTRQELEAGRLYWNELTPPEYRDRDAQAIAEVKADGVCTSYEKEFIHKDGQRIPILIGGGYFNDRNRAGVFFALDLTDRKQAEAEREQLLIREQAAREQAETANRIKDEFLAVLSHELRSPLNPILGWSKLLQQGKLDSARIKTALDAIDRNAQLQVQLIDDLLDISRILRGKLSLTVRSVKLSAVISAALETVHLAAEAKSIHIQTVSSDDPVVIGDAGRLQQVVWNLLSNAVKFTPRSGQVTVALTQTRTDAQIQVIDTGKGIKPDFLPYVFEHFRQEDGATTRKFGGLGLGLAIARQIVEMHGGQISADSSGEGAGATFTVQIPLASRPTTSPVLEPSSSLTGDLSGIRILVVDDETDSREFVAFVLEQANAIVTCVASGIDAFQAFSQSVPDLIVSDIGMPEIDGYMLMRRIRSLPLEQGGQIPAIALTAYVGELDQQQAIAVGFQQHLSKPIDPATLITAIVGLDLKNVDRQPA